MKNIDKSMEFYGSVLGFSLPKDVNKNYIPVRKDDVVLGLGEMKNLPESHPLKAVDGQQIGLGVEIVLEVENVKNVYNRVVEKSIQSRLN
ncbi:VOC family protein [Salinibacillus kushneri]|uniref:VOC family protein n=1 Tax=Salinibacillus kushneri TaxID=237682 RepID=UPI0015A5AEB9|nr:VOC family protein [Salinibacillus kushneri]